MTFCINDNAKRNICSPSPTGIAERLQEEVSHQQKAYTRRQHGEAPGGGTQADLTVPQKLVDDSREICD